RPARGVTRKSAELERAPLQALLEPLETLAQRDDTPRQRVLARVVAVAVREDAGDVGPGEAAVAAQDEERLLVGGELGAEPRDAVARLGARAGERLAADLRGERADLRKVRQRDLAAPAAVLPPEPPGGVAGERIGPGAERRVAAEGRARLPQVERED